jgi:hypothetical protein
MDTVLIQNKFTAVAVSATLTKALVFYKHDIFAGVVFRTISHTAVGLLKPPF